MDALALAASGRPHPIWGLGLNGLITQLLAALPFTTDSLTVLGGGRMRVSPVPRGGWEWTWDQVT